MTYSEIQKRAKEKVFSCTKEICSEDCIECYNEMQEKDKKKDLIPFKPRYIFGRQLTLEDLTKEEIR